MSRARPSRSLPRFFRQSASGEVTIDNSIIYYLYDGLQCIAGPLAPHRVQFTSVNVFDAVNAGLELAVYLSTAPHGALGSHAYLEVLLPHYLSSGSLSSAARRRDDAYLSAWAVRVLPFLRTLCFYPVASLDEATEAALQARLTTPEGVHELCMHILSTAAARLRAAASQGQRLPVPADLSTLFHCVSLSLHYRSNAKHGRVSLGSPDWEFSYLLRMVAQFCDRLPTGVPCGALLLSMHHSQHSESPPAPLSVGEDPRE